MWVFLYVREDGKTQLLQKADQISQHSSTEATQKTRQRKNEVEKMKTESKTNTPMNLQFFAEQETDKPDAQTQEQETDKPDTPTIEEIMAELAKERAEKEKTKVALDKALKETGELKKNLRQKMTAQEQEDEAKREQDEQHKAYVASLEEFKHKTEAKERYLMQGMSVEMAAKAAEAEVSGDMDALATIQKQHTDSIIRAKEKEWKKSTVGINAGVDGEFSVTKEQFNKMSYAKRVELKKRNPELYKQLSE